MQQSLDFHSVLEQYQFHTDWHISEGESGMNNTTRIITAGEQKYVLRVYNNHRDAGIITLEHEVLAALRAECPPFAIPVPIHNKAGKTVTEALDGRLATLVQYIEGDRPDQHDERHIYSLGQVTGQLSEAMARIQLNREPLYDPYYLLESSYAHIDHQKMLQLSALTEQLRQSRDVLLQLMKEREELHCYLEDISKMPMQWIHGDLVFNNTVAEGGRIIGVLDFEFCSRDVRLMELAVIAADLLKPGLPQKGSSLQLLFAGYKETIEVSSEERRLFLPLMKLRLLDVAFHFINRYGEGLDSDQVLCQVIEDSAYGLSWLNTEWKDDWL